jgi:hypothetical protein
MALRDDVCVRRAARHAGSLLIRWLNTLAPAHGVTHSTMARALMHNASHHRWYMRHEGAGDRRTGQRLRAGFRFGRLRAVPDRLVAGRRERVVFRFLAVVFRFFAVVFRFLGAAGFFSTRSGSVARPVSWFHSSKTSGVIFPSTSSWANLRRCALLLNGMVRSSVTDSCRTPLSPFGSPGAHPPGRQPHTSLPNAFPVTARSEST